MKKTVSGAALVLVAASLALAGAPSLINYQGVLRDSADEPLDGDFNMVFRFFDAETFGNELLVDEHLAAGMGAVTVTGGVFNVHLGSGAVADGSGPGTFGSLAEVFRSHEAVYLEVEIESETLSPRTRIVAAAYALSPDPLPVTIFRDDFEGSVLSAVDWTSTIIGGAAISFIDGAVQLGTQVSPFTPGTAIINGTRAFSVLDGTLVFTSRVLDAYVDSAVYGNRQPRGLVAGTDRNDAIEFVNATPTPSKVGCRTVAGGVATETVVDIGQTVRASAVYRIVARPGEVTFHINGVLVATHTTNIPTAALNVYFGTSDGGFGDVPMVIDSVMFERIP